MTKERINFSEITDYSAEIEKAKYKEIFITGKELRVKENLEKLRTLIEQNKDIDILITLDVSSGGFVRNGVLDLCYYKESVNLDNRYQDTRSDKPHLPENIKRLKIVVTEGDVTSIDDNFLSCYNELEEVDLSHLSNIKQIEDNFLNRSDNIKSIILPNFGEKPNDYVKEKVIKPIVKSFSKSENEYLKQKAKELSAKYLS